MKKISAVIITYNEAEKIERALSSLKSVCDEIVVVDSCSTDQTVQLCRRFTDRIIDHPWEGYRAQKQFATNQATHPWVLSLDADEMLSSQLKDQILQWKKKEDHFKGYYIPRKTFFMGRWIEHTTWYPDWQLRLFERSYGLWEGGRVHESFSTTGATGRFSGHIFHHTYSTFSEYLKQLEHFSSLAAADSFDQGKRTHLFNFLTHPLFSFLKNYLLRLGILDGLPGLSVSLLAAVSVLFKYFKLWELQLNDQGALIFEPQDEQSKNTLRRH